MSLTWFPSKYMVPSHRRRSIPLGSSSLLTSTLSRLWRGSHPHTRHRRSRRLLPLRRRLLRPLYNLPHLLRPQRRHAPLRQRTRPPRHRPRHVGDWRLRRALCLLLPRRNASRLPRCPNCYGYRLRRLYAAAQVSPADVPHHAVPHVLLSRVEFICARCAWVVSIRARCAGRYDGVKVVSGPGGD